MTENEISPEVKKAIVGVVDSVRGETVLWRDYALRLKAAMLATRTIEDGLVAELRRLSPENQAANDEFRDRRREELFRYFYADKDISTEVDGKI